jgi:hypothetical protein
MSGSVGGPANSALGFDPGASELPQLDTAGAAVLRSALSRLSSEGGPEGSFGSVDDAMARWFPKPEEGAPAPEGEEEASSSGGEARLRQAFDEALRDCDTDLCRRATILRFALQMANPAKFIKEHEEHFENVEAVLRQAFVEVFRACETLPDERLIILRFARQMPDPAGFIKAHSEYFESVDNVLVAFGCPLPSTG